MWLLKMDVRVAFLRDMLDGAAPFSPHYDASHRSVRLSMKMFNKTPADLPPDLRPLLMRWLGAAPAALEGYIRPGCVFLTLQATVTQVTP